MDEGRHTVIQKTRDSLSELSSMLVTLPRPNDEVFVGSDRMCTISPSDGDCLELKRLLDRSRKLFSINKKYLSYSSF